MRGTILGHKRDEGADEVVLLVTQAPPKAC